MEVIVRFTSGQPPTGRVLTPTGEHPFEGWLALLRLLELAVTSTPAR